MSTWGEPFRRRLRLLCELLPIVAREPRFALKGGTAINLFEHDLPRLSVDVDLTWLPVGEFAGDQRAISDALAGIALELRAPPLQLQVTESRSPTAEGITRLIASRRGARVQIETTPVMRGSVHPVRTMRVQPSVEAEFGFVEMQVLDFADLYAGKLAAALSRQHPRDLFDIGLLLDSGRLDGTLWRTFLVYLTASPKPAWELLEPGEPRDLESTFRSQFEGMTAAPVTVGNLLESRNRLLSLLPSLMDDASRDFLRSVEDGAPDFARIGLPDAVHLPGVRHKLANLERRTLEKCAADRRRLEATLTRLRRQA
jgi:predicted nucleotidyltransferase component of viral defense system